MTITIPENIGQFYLGTEILPNDGVPVLYDAADLTTHAVIIGMTGSGKTGLGISLLEEAALDNIPVIAIDPKGDLGNLALNFPARRPEDFLPYADEAALRQSGDSAQSWAENTAQKWAQGIDGSGQSAARQQTLKNANPVHLYTPGADYGIPLSLLANLTAPDLAIREDAQSYADYLDATAGALLALIGEDSEALGPAHIFLSHLLKHYWDHNEDLDLAALIQGINQPPFERIGVLPVAQVFPPKSRDKLAMGLNALLASPSFAAWRQGAPLDCQQLFYDADNRAQTSVLNISHLSDAERMFFVTLLLGNLISWMRRQSGSSTLRAILYMDELFGYLPPSANPPSKKPLLTLLKQARAFGLGLVLSTQNPVDLDYKALSNAGTWLIGRLQTAQDRARVADGLTSASAQGLDRAELDTWFDRIDKRLFLLHNIHEKAPCLFKTRFAMSYLAGPLSREHTRALTASNPRRASAPVASADNGHDSRPPILPNGIARYYFPSAQASATTHYYPLAIAAARLHFSDSKSGARSEQTLLLQCPFDGDAPDWSQSSPSPLTLAQLQNAPHQPCQHHPAPVSVQDAAQWKAWEKALATWLRQNQTVAVYHSKALDLYSEPGESETAFRARLTTAAHEKRDAAMAALRMKYAKKQTALDKQQLAAQSATAREQAQSSQSLLQAGLAIGGAILGAFGGRKVMSTSNIGKAQSAIKSAAKVQKERQDIAAAAAKEQLIAEQIAQLEAELAAELQTLREQFDPQTLELTEKQIAVKASDIDIRFLALGYQPLG
ncbi:MAG: DUF87 domain-containing protein [Cardiobacteriaceae bacterium]|nr:DUF87 domain-containing protein [Cardiobacteriaceae bacterium]